MPAQSQNYIARADIPPAKFVKQDGSDNGVVPCVADDIAVGISYEGSREAPIPSVTPLQAIDGEPCGVYTETWSCEIVAGAAIVSGEYLKPDANADAVPAAAGDQYSARARSNAAPGERVRVVVERGVAA